MTIQGTPITLSLFRFRSQCLQRHRHRQSDNPSMTLSVVIELAILPSLRELPMAHAEALLSEAFLHCQKLFLGEDTGLRYGFASNLRRLCEYGISSCWMQLVLHE